MQSPTSDDSPQKAFLRKRFKEKCVERAQRARERSLNIKRWGSEQSSDGFDMDTDMDVDGGEDDDDEFGLDDEVCSMRLLSKITIWLMARIFSRSSVA